MTVVDDQITNLRREAVRIRIEGFLDLRIADAIDAICDDVESLDIRIDALVTTP